MRSRGSATGEDVSTRPSTAPSEHFEHLHRTAARMDGMVKILVGLVMFVFSIGLASCAVLGLQYLFTHQVMKWWAFAIGIPGILLALAGVGLMAWGLLKMFAGRGRG